MLDEAAINELKLLLCDRFTPEELIEFLGVSTGEVFDRFVDECVELDMSEIL
jgi:hypothetical protein